jgi:hypothetical protein
MKKLLDESTDELTCSLLRAGAEHRPSPAAKAQLILALGAGGALGLFSSNAFAWLGTSAGKLTVLSMTLTVVGAVYVGTSYVGTSYVSTSASSSELPGPNSNVAAFEDVPSAAPAGQAARSGGRPETPAGGELQVAQLQAAGAELQPAAAATGVSGAALAQPLQLPADGVRSEDAPIGAASGSGKLASRSGARRPRRASAAAASPAEEVVARARLDAEVKLVDQMRSAAQHDDRAALTRLVQVYEAGFPEGELRQEVAQFAVRLERP